MSINKSLLSLVFSDELKEFYINHINEKYPKMENDLAKNMIGNLYTTRLVYWNQQVTKELKIIGSNPTKELTQVRLKNIKKNKDCTDKMYYAIIDYLKAEFEHNMNLGNTDAYIYLSNMKVKNINPITFNTFKFKGDLKRFYKQCVEYKVINKETKLDSFKMAYNGTETSKTSIIKLTCAKTTFTCFMTLLNDAGLFENYPKNFHKVGEAITGEIDFKNALAKYKTTGTFENEDKFKHLVKTLSQNL